MYHNTIESDDKTRMVHVTCEHITDSTYRVCLQSPLPRGALTFEDTVCATSEEEAHHLANEMAMQQLQLLNIQCYPANPNRYGYHQIMMPKGVIGEASKILEEALELWDAHSQKNPIMELVELSDLMGAIQLYLHKQHPSITLDELLRMSEVTQRAFKNGRR